MASRRLAPASVCAKLDSGSLPTSLRGNATTFWPLGFDAVVFQVWTVTRREPLPAGSIWHDIDAAHDEAAMIETVHARIPPTP